MGQQLVRPSEHRRLRALHIHFDVEKPPAGPSYRRLKTENQKPGKTAQGADRFARRILIPRNLCDGK